MRSAALIGFLVCAVACDAPVRPIPFAVPGPVADAGAGAGAGSGPEAGPGTDAGSGADAGEGADAGAVADAGAGPDAGPTAAPPPSGWRWENPLPTGAALRGVWAAASDDVWAAGDSGTLLHFDGRSWSVVPRVVTASLDAVWGAGPADVWAAGEQGTLLHYDGVSWSQALSGTAAPLGVLSGTASDDIWASSAAIPVIPQVTNGGVPPGATLLHFDGHAWAQIGRIAPTAVAALARDDVWVGTADSLLHFDGSAWTSFAAPGGFVRALAGVAGGPLFAITEQAVQCSPRSDAVFCPADTLLRFDGLNWNPTAGPATGALVAAGGALWSFDSSGPDTLARFDGIAWVTLASAPPVAWYAKWSHALAPISDADVWIVGEDGRRMHYDGAALSEPDAFRLETLWSMAGSSECDVWAVGNEALVLHRACDGSWTPVDLVAAGLVPADDQQSFWARQLLAVATSAPDDVWIEDSGSTLLHFDGASWSTEPAPSRGLLIAVARGELYIASEHGLYHRDGSGWQLVFGGWITGVWASSPSDVWVSDDLQIHHFDGATWSISLSLQQSTGPVVGKALWGSGPNDVWWANPGKTFFHFDGSSWTAVASPLEAVYDMFVSGKGDVWAFGWTQWYDPGIDGWGLYRYEGGAWSEAGPDFFANLVYGTGSLLFAYGEAGVILARP